MFSIIYSIKLLYLTLIFNINTYLATIPKEKGIFTDAFPPQFYSFLAFPIKHILRLSYMSITNLMVANINNKFEKNKIFFNIFLFSMKNYCFFWLVTKRNHIHLHYCIAHSSIAVHPDEKIVRTNISHQHREKGNAHIRVVGGRAA